MAKYRVRPGYTFGAYGTFREGMIVELPELDAQPFLDKLELVPNEVPAGPEAPEVPESVAEPEIDVPDVDVPEASVMPDEPVAEPAKVQVKNPAARSSGKTKG